MYSVTDFPGTMDRTYHPLPFRTLLCILIILVLALAAPVSAAVHTLNPGDSIFENITDASDGDTIILNPGIYNQHDISIDKNIIIKANMSAGGSAADTIIDSESDGRIFSNYGAYSLAIDNLTLRNGHGIPGYGGAIYSKGGTLTITSSFFSNCSADIDGGAIFSDMASIVTVTTSTFSNCSASNGGAIYSYNASIVTVTSSTFSNCSASNGGAIYSYSSTVTITTSTFSNCSASNGGAIYSDSASIVTIHFSRIYNDTTIAIQNDGSTVDAANNWWGTNADPSGYTSGGVTVSPWLVLNITATPSSITTAQTSAIRTYLTNNSAGTDTTSGGIFVPAGIPVAFASPAAPAASCRRMAISPPAQT
jgi:hypothetical protein